MFVRLSVDLRDAPCRMLKQFGGPGLLPAVGLRAQMAEEGEEKAEDEDEESESQDRE